MVQNLMWIAAGQGEDWCNETSLAAINGAFGRSPRVETQSAS